MKALTEAPHQVAFVLELVKGELTLLVQVLHRTDLTSLLNQSDRSEYWLPVSKSRTGLTGWWLTLVLSVLICRVSFNRLFTPPLGDITRLRSFHYKTSGKIST